MRSTLLLLLALAGCVHATAYEDASEPPPGSGGGGAPPNRCVLDSDCVPAAAACCDCPTYAVPSTDPYVRACKGVVCQPAECRDNATAICTPEGFCKLACAPLACSNESCPDGYARDDNGCLTCACAEPDPGGCKLDSECVQTRADCCGCKQGGIDTAVRAVDQMVYDDMLGCPPAPACPGIDVCTGDAPQCVQGSCQLLPPGLPPNACGRFDLMVCPAGQACTVNLSDPANMQGLGVCAPV